MAGDLAVQVPATLLHEQIGHQLCAWGMGADAAAETADVLVEADLMGIDSHGVALLTLYDDLVSTGGVVPGGQPRVARSFGATAVIDAGGALGHVPSLRAMDLAIERARAFGIGAVAVRNSNHFGAAGIYALRAARAGLIGVATTAVHKASIVPTFGRVPRLGTNPIAFAAPGRGGPAFLLDMATSTVAIGKVKLAARAGKPLPAGWALDAEGRPQTDARRAAADRLMTPLGGDRGGGGHKGYGLAAMVEVLSTLLGGASYAPLRPEGGKPNDVGHFLMALAPEAFRDAGGFEDDLDAFIACLRDTPPAAGAEAVLVAGDPEFAARAQRERDGVPVPRSLLDDLAAMAARSNAPFVLGAQAA
jgi:LDH2 family malate/lactate/ureidoglycolate dehydrogenase